MLSVADGIVLYAFFIIERIIFYGFSAFFSRSFFPLLFSLDSLRLRDYYATAMGKQCWHRRFDSNNWRRRITSTQSVPSVPHHGGRAGHIVEHRRPSVPKDLWPLALRIFIQLRFWRSLFSDFPEAIDRYRHGLLVLKCGEERSKGKPDKMYNSKSAEAIEETLMIRSLYRTIIRK